MYILNAYYKPTPWLELENDKIDINKTRKDSNEKIKKCSIASMNAKAFL